MSIPNLTLQTDKNNTSVDVDQITIRQSESGLVLRANLITATGAAYNLNNCQITFGENKKGGKMVADDNVEIVDATAGTIKYVLNTAVYQESGDAWFEITDMAHQLIDTTTNFLIKVVKQADLQVDNENYWSKAETMLTHIKALMQKAQNDLDSFKATNDKKLTDSINDFKITLKSYYAKLTDFETKFNKLSSDYSTELNSLKSKWEQQQTDFVKNNQQIVNNKINKFQDEFNTWLNEADVKLNAEVAKLNKELTDDKKIQAELQKSIDSAIKAIKTIKGVDFTKFAHLDDLKKYYTKAEIKSLDPLNSADGNNIYDSTINLDTYSTVGMTKFLNCKLRSTGKMIGFDQATNKLYGWIFNIPKWNGAAEVQQIVYIWDYGNGELIYARNRVDTKHTKDFKKILPIDDKKNAHVTLTINGHKADSNGNIDLSDYFGTLDKFGSLYGMTNAGVKKVYSSTPVDPNIITETGIYKISSCIVRAKVSGVALNNTQWGWLIVNNYNENDSTNALYQLLIINEKAYYRVCSLQYKTFPDFRSLQQEITVNNVKPDNNGNIPITIPDTTQIIKDISDLKNEYTNLSDREIVHHCEDLATGTAYSKAHPNVIVGTP